MTKAETPVAQKRRRRFTTAIDEVIAAGHFPSAGRIRVQLGRAPRPSGQLNGEETRWRREHLESLGWTRPVPKGGDPVRARWIPPKEKGNGRS